MPYHSCRTLPLLFILFTLLAFVLPSCLVIGQSSTGPFGGDGETPATNSSTGDASSNSTLSSSGMFDSSSTGDGSQIIPGGSVGRGGSSFGSTNAVFLTTVVDVWIDIILWTMVFVAIAFLCASFVAIRVNKSVRYLWLWLPPAMLIWGGYIGFVHGAVSAVLIAAASIAIPYPVGIDIAAGLGIGQAICIIYFHLGRADFIHR